MQKFTLTRPEFQLNVEIPFTPKYVVYSFGVIMAFNQDKGLYLIGMGEKAGQFYDLSVERLNDMKAEYKVCNRIYKPIYLIVWTDLKNGKVKHWESCIVDFKSDKDLCRELWEKLGDIPINEEGEIEESFEVEGVEFEIGTDRTYIWYWFEERFDIVLGEYISNPDIS